MNKYDYKKLVQRHLDDFSTYMAITRNPLNEVKKELIILIEKHKDSIDMSTKKFLTYF